jgi:hypothetical protein
MWANGILCVLRSVEQTWNIIRLDLGYAAPQPGLDIAGANSVRCSPKFAAARRHAIALGKQGRAHPRVCNDVAVQNVRLDP